MRKKNIVLVVAALLTLFIYSFRHPSKVVHAGAQLKTIVIDPGHGGLDPGCNGASEIWEKDVTLAISLKLGKMIEDSLKDVKVIYTRKTDIFVELGERPNIANREKADFFISIHCNANTSPAPYGSETYFMGLHKTEGNLAVAKRENSAITYEKDYQNNENYGGFDPNSAESHIIFNLVQNAFLQQSLKFSQLVEKNTNTISKIKSRGVHQAGFLVLWRTSMPSVLVETGFLTNPTDRAYLKSEDGQKTIALGIFKAVKQYKYDLEKNKPKVDANKEKKDSVKVKVDTVAKPKPAPKPTVIKNDTTKSTAKTDSLLKRLHRN